MKYAIYLFKAFLVLLLTYALTRWWLGTAWSERYWTWLNNQFGGQRLGLASDVELITALILALLISVGVTVLGPRSIQYFQRKQR